MVKKAYNYMYSKMYRVLMVIIKNIYYISCCKVLCVSILNTCLRHRLAANTFYNSIIALGHRKNNRYHIVTIKL